MLVMHVRIGGGFLIHHETSVVLDSMSSNDIELRIQRAASMDGKVRISKGEKVALPGDVSLTCLKVLADCVSVGIEYPKNIQIDRIGSPAA